MTWYVILFFVAILTGMAISVAAFGTGGKRSKVFEDIYFSVEDIYFSVEDVDGVGIIYTKTGDYSALMEIRNPVQKYSADTDSYYEYSQLFTKICQSLGEGYILQKQDIFIRKSFNGQKRYITEVVIDEAEFVESSGSASGDVYRQEPAAPTQSFNPPPANTVAASAPTAPNMQIEAPMGGFDEGQSGELPFEI